MALISGGIGVVARFLAAALLLIDPGLVTDLIGLVLLAIGLGLQRLRPDPMATPPPAPWAAPRCSPSRSSPPRWSSARSCTASCVSMPDPLARW